jgi:hypothetical protein
MPLPFAPPRYRQLPSALGLDAPYAPGMAPSDFQPQNLAQQGLFQMTAAGPVPQAMPQSGHPPMGMPVWGGPGSPVGKQPAGPTGRAFEGYGNDVLDPRTLRGGGGPVQRPPNPRAAGPMPIVDGGDFYYGGRQPANPRTTGPFQSNMMPTYRGGMGQAPSLNWQPDPIEAPKYGGSGGGRSGNRPKGPFFGNNTPNYRQGGGLNLEPGQWHQSPGYIGSGGAVMNSYEPGSAHMPPGYLQGGLFQAPGVRGGGGGSPAGGYGGGGSGPFQAFFDAMNAANASNAERFNKNNQGYSAMRDYASQLLSGLGGQQRRDTETAFNNRMSQATQNLMNSGLANSSVLADQSRGNARDMSAQMTRNEESLMRERLGIELPLLEKQLNFNERFNDPGPDANLFAQLAAQAAAGGFGGGPRYGAPITIGSGDIGYQLPFVGGMGWMPGYGGGSQLVKNFRPSYGVGTGSGTGGLMGGNHGTSIFPKNAGTGFNPAAFLESYTGDGDINSLGSPSPVDPAAFRASIGGVNSIPFIGSLGSNLGYGQVQVAWDSDFNGMPSGAVIDAGMRNSESEMLNRLLRKYQGLSW